MDVSDEWKRLFEKAGITSEQLKDKNTAAFVVNFVAAALEEGEEAAEARLVQCSE